MFSVVGIVKSGANFIFTAWQFAKGKRIVAFFAIIMNKLQQAIQIVLTKPISS